MKNILTTRPMRVQSAQAGFSAQCTHRGHGRPCARFEDVTCRCASRKIEGFIRLGINSLLDGGALCMSIYILLGQV